jgi:hypothetical protein
MCIIAFPPSPVRSAPARFSSRYNAIFAITTFVKSRVSGSTAGEDACSRRKLRREPRDSRSTNVTTAKVGDCYSRGFGNEQSTELTCRGESHSFSKVYRRSANHRYRTHGRTGSHLLICARQSLRTLSARTKTSSHASIYF